MSPRARRLARGWAAAFVTTTFAAGSHAVVDGSWPPALVIALSMCLAAPVCMLLAGAVLSRAAVTAAVAVSQGLFHGLFAHSGHGATVVDHTHHLIASADPQLVIAVSGTAHHGSGMLAAHALAAAATYVLLRHGEVAAMRSLGAVALRVLRLLVRPVPLPVPRLPRRTSWLSPRALADQLLLPRVHGHRGPPAPAALPAPC